MSSERFLNERWLKKLDRKTKAMIDRIGVDRKTLDEVFDKSTLLTIDKLISNRVLDIVDFPISTGKEGNVFLAVTPKKKKVAIKIYRTSTSTFKHISEYILDDPRFKSIHKTRRDMIYAWTKKEYKNLERLNKVGVKSPKPIVSVNNVLVMQYIGDSRCPAPMLKDVTLSDPQEIFDKIVGYIDLMYNKANLVHSDLSAFNILIYRKKPYIIDLGQGVLLEHYNSDDFLKRDIQNIVNYFNKYRIKQDKKKIYKQITKKEW